MLLLASNVKALRKQKTLTQAALAEKAGVDQKTVSNIETAGGDRETVTIASAARVADGLGERLSLLVSPPDPGVWRLVAAYEDADDEQKAALDQIARLISNKKT